MEVREPSTTYLLSPNQPLSSPTGGSRSPSPCPPVPSHCSFEPFPPTSSVLGLLADSARLSIPTAIAVCQAPGSSHSNVYGGSHFPSPLVSPPLWYGSWRSSEGPTLRPPLSLLPWPPVTYFAQPCPRAHLTYVPPPPPLA